MLDSFINLLFYFRISKGLSEKVFAKFEEQRKTSGEQRKTLEEDINDTGEDKLFKSLGMICIFRIFGNLSLISKLSLLLSSTQILIISGRFLCSLFYLS
jgi:hypothetical protein